MIQNSEIIAMKLTCAVQAADVNVDTMCVVNAVCAPDVRFSLIAALIVLLFRAALLWCSSSDCSVGGALLVVLWCCCLDPSERALLVLSVPWLTSCLMADECDWFDSCCWSGDSLLHDCSSTRQFEQLFDAGQTITVPTLTHTLPTLTHLMHTLPTLPHTLTALTHTGISQSHLFQHSITPPLSLRHNHDTLESPAETPQSQHITVSTHTHWACGTDSLPSRPWTTRPLNRAIFAKAGRPMDDAILALRFPRLVLLQSPRQRPLRRPRS